MNPNSEIINIKKKVLEKYYLEDTSIYEIGVDEVGRGPLFGRVYAAAVILPKGNTFDYSKMKDSKKFHSKSKIIETSDYIKNNAIAWSVNYETESTIDEINILQATQKCMHNCIKDIINKVIDIKNPSLEKDDSFYLLIDGNYFLPYFHFNEKLQSLDCVPYSTIEGGDNKFASIAAASILAKVERDKYIEDLCKNNSELSEKYSLDTNKGYGSKKHLDGIKKFGITDGHRKTFGICKNY
jgi:ribonuclease HII